MAGARSSGRGAIERSSSPTKRRRRSLASPTFSATAPRKALSSGRMIGPAFTALERCATVRLFSAPDSIELPNTRRGGAGLADPRPTSVRPSASCSHRFLAGRSSTRPSVGNASSSWCEGRLTKDVSNAAAARFLGRRAILEQHPHDVPLSRDCSPAPAVHAATKAIRTMLRAAYRQFVDAYREAALKLRRGDRLVRFPAGAFPPPMPCPTLSG